MIAIRSGDAERDRAVAFARGGGALGDVRRVVVVPVPATLLDADSSDMTAPATRARPDGAEWLLEGRKRLVSFAQRADRLLVPAVADAGVGLFLVDPRADAVTRTASVSSTGEPLSELSALPALGFRVYLRVLSPP